MNVLVTLTSAGADTGPFNLYCNADNYIATLATGISREVALAGYLCTTVPSSATIIRMQSLGTCSNYVDLDIIVPVTTTTTTTPTPTTTTTTTTIAPPITTTTTTTAGGGTTTTTTTAGGGTTTTTTTAGGGTTTTTTTSGGGGTTTTTTTGSPTTTTTTTVSYEIYNLYYPCGTTTPATQTVPNLGSYTTGNIVQASNGLCYTVASAQTSIIPATQTVMQEFSDCSTCEAAPAPTTTTTTTIIIQQWYQLTNCTDSTIQYSAAYTSGTFALNDRVTDILMNTYRISNTYLSDPGGAGLFISPTGQTGCPSGTTTTTTTAAPVATKIGVVVTTVQGSDLDCLGTPYSRYTSTAVATLYDQYNNPINAGSSIDVTINTTYNPCYGGSSPSSYNITILSGTASGQVVWDSSRTVDCGEGNCLLETETYNCTASNTASLPWTAGTVTC